MLMKGEEWSSNLSDIYVPREIYITNLHVGIHCCKRLRHLPALHALFRVSVLVL